MTHTNESSKYEHGSNSSTMYTIALSSGLLLKLAAIMRLRITKVMIINVLIVRILRATDCHTRLSDKSNNINGAHNVAK
jgi:hypothetical protein